jgi:putative methyltransferase (TIGR04325 family)
LVIPLREASDGRALVGVKISPCKVEVIEGADSFDVDAGLELFAHGENGPVSGVAEAEMQGRVMGEPGFAERVLLEDERTWVEAQVFAEKKPQVRPARRETMPELGRRKTPAPRPLVLGKQGLVGRAEATAGIQIPRPDQDLASAVLCLGHGLSGARFWTPRSRLARLSAAEGEPVKVRTYLKHAALLALGRYRMLTGANVRFRGAYASFDEAVAHVRPGKLAGYDHDSVVDVSKELMQQVPLWDYPILYWLGRLAPEIARIVDAGGHIGVKYRAFGPYLDLDRIDWIVYDLPALVKAGRAQRRSQDRTLSFVDRIDDAPAADVLLASGLLPYLHEPLTDLVRRLRVPPRHILLNKVITRDGPTVVTLENFGSAEVPYQIRNVGDVPAALADLGYDIIDTWTIESLAHRIQTHPELGRCAYRGYVARLRGR